jgi:molybdenum cofactor cytidylyltransferase
MSPGSYAAIVLAAGFSSRMKEFKPLLSLGGQTITDRVISTFLSNDVDVLLVTGWRGGELVAGIRHRDITIAENPDYESGMLSSVQAGVKRLSPRHSSFFIMPVDIPLVRRAIVKRLIDCATENPKRIIYPVFNTTRGHPPLIPSSLIPEITGWKKQGGLDTILSLHRELDLEVNVADENILLDIDDKSDFTGLVERFRHYDIPGERECDAILDIAGTPDNLRRHCRKVAEVADAISGALAAAGAEIDMEAVHAAAILHDVARVYDNHETVGAQMLYDSGFRKIGDIIAAHHDLTDDIAAVTIESKIVFLADKYVQGDKLVTIAERYRIAEEKYGSTPDAVRNIRRGKGRTIKVKKELETILGHSLDDIIFGIFHRYN